MPPRKPLKHPGTEWVTLAEAETLAGVKVATLRKWYAAERIAHTKGPGLHGPQVFVRAAEVLELAEQTRTLKAGTAAAERTLAPVMAQLQEMLAQVRAEYAEREAGLKAERERLERERAEALAEVARLTERLRHRRFFSKG